MHILPTYLEQGIAPDVIDDTNPDDVYLGFFKYDMISNPYHCLIKRIQKINGITKVLYPEGRYVFNKSWFDRLIITDWRYRDFPPEKDYGFLYNGFAIIDEKLIYADGWHVPTDDEWQQLADYLGGVNVAGGKMKDVNPSYWESPNVGATNESKFNGRGNGARLNDGRYGDVFKNNAYYWTSDFATINSLNDSLLSIGLNNAYELLEKSQVGETLFKYLNDAVSLRLIKDVTDLSNSEEGIYEGNDGKMYKTICIGDQEWLAEDLMETQFQDGSDIPLVIPTSDWQLLSTSARTPIILFANV